MTYEEIMKALGGLGGAVKAENAPVDRSSWWKPSGKQNFQPKTLAPTPVTASTATAGKTSFFAPSKGVKFLGKSAARIGKNLLIEPATYLAGKIGLRPMLDAIAPINDLPPEEIARQGKIQSILKSGLSKEEKQSRISALQAQWAELDKSIANTPGYFGRVGGLMQAEAGRTAQRFGDAAVQDGIGGVLGEFLGLREGSRDYAGAGGYYKNGQIRMNTPTAGTLISPRGSQPTPPSTKEKTTKPMDLSFLGATTSAQDVYDRNLRAIQGAASDGVAPVSARDKLAAAGRGSMANVRRYEKEQAAKEDRKVALRMAAQGQEKVEKPKPAEYVKRALQLYSTMSIAQRNEADIALAKKFEKNLDDIVGPEGDPNREENLKKFREAALLQAYEQGFLQ